MDIYSLSHQTRGLKCIVLYFRTMVNVMASLGHLGQLLPINVCVLESLCVWVWVRLATKSARVKVLVLVYELNVKLTYFKSPARTTDNSQLQKRDGKEWERGLQLRRKWEERRKNVTHIHIILFSQVFGRKKAPKVKSQLATRAAGVTT